MKALLVIIILAILFRLINLNQSFWLDEAISALAARDFSYLGIIFDFLKIDNHPPLFYLLLRGWGKLAGFVDINLRILPVILGSLTVFLIYKITLIIQNKKAAIIAALLGATSPLLIYYSQELRMYILITFLCAAEVFVFQLILKKETFLKWVLFSLILCLLFFSDYITVFFFPIFFFHPILKKDLGLFKRVLLSFLPVVILFVLWYPYFSAQLLVNQNLVNIFPGWQNIIGGATFKNLAVFWMKIVLGRISFEPKIIYYGLVGIFSLPILISLYFAVKDFKKNLIIWLWLIIPVISGFGFSFIVPVFNYFRFIYVLPALLILCALAISKLDKKIIYLLMGSILIGNIIGLGIYYLDPSQQRENWRQAVSFIEKNAKTSDLVVLEFHEQLAPYRWYSTGKVDAIGATDSYFANKEKTQEKLESSLQNKTGVYYFEYLRDLTDPQKYVEQTLAEDGFKKGEVSNNFYNIGQVTYWSR